LLDFEDFTPPVISDYKYEKRLWNINNMVTYSMRVEAKVIDEGIQEVKSVAIRYSTDQGATWKEISMTSLGNNTYEGVIPEQGPGLTVRFYVMANDTAHNSASTSVAAYDEGVVGLTIIWSIIIVLVILVIVAVTIKLNRIRKIRRYTHKKPQL
jgi:hypothetical protein